MSSILSPEEIYELDTFTLEEKIEEIEALGNHYLHRQILQLAKLELLERLEIQDFGRKLANDEIKIEVEEVKLPPLSLNRQIGVKKQINPINQMMKKLQECMISQQQLNKIVKSSTNHSNKLFKNQRRTSEVIKKPVSKKIEIPTAKVRQKPIIKMPQQNVPLKPKIKQVLTKKEKLKEQIKAIHIEYRQNDVYEDMMVPMSPQKLMDCAILDETIEEAIQNNSKLNSLQESIKQQIQQKNQIINQKIEIFESPTYNKSFIIEQIQNKQESIDKLKNIQDQKRIKVVQILQIQEQKTKIQTEFIDLGKREIETINLDNLCEQNSQEKEKQLKFAKQSRSISLKNIIQTHTSRKEAKTNNEKDKEKKDIIILALPQSLNKNTDFDAIKPKAKMQHCGSNTISNFKIILNPNLKQSYFPYHQIIPNFNKLFPHSKNLLITLRNIEQNLIQHFSKNIFEKSKNSELARLDANQQTYKVVSESQKAKKYNNLFDIDLTSFYERGKVMLNRVSCISDFDHQKNVLFYRVVRTKEDVYDIISSGFHRVLNWYELVHGEELKSSWNLLWTWSKPQIDFGDLFYFQRVNHFIGNKQIARKDLLKKNIQKIKKLGTKMKTLFDIIPETYLLPGESIQFIKKFKEYSKLNSNNFWILKPVGLSRGRGISVVSKLEEIVFSEPIVLQRYLKNPLLLDGFKFDMRIYVLVTSMNPLEAYIYREGFARISTQKYSNNQEDIGNKFMHLTNFSINKQNVQEKSEKDMTFEEKLGGCKISLKMLQSKLQEKRINWKTIENQIQEIVLKSLIACMNTIPSNPNCFELFGYDIFVDQDLKCWLLQVNSSPSLQKDYTLDEIIKQQLIDDTIQLIQPIKYDRQKLLQVVQRRRKELQGLKSHINTNNNSIQQLDEDLHFILHGKPLRKYGQGSHPMNYKRIAPGNKYFQIIKAVQQYKIDPIIKAQ